jgi:hypothetical protein
MSNLPGRPSSSSLNAEEEESQSRSTPSPPLNRNNLSILVSEDDEGERDEEGKGKVEEGDKNIEVVVIPSKGEAEIKEGEGEAREPELPHPHRHHHSNNLHRHFHRRKKKVCTCCSPPSLVFSIFLPPSLHLDLNINLCFLSCFFFSSSPYSFLFSCISSPFFSCFSLFVSRSRCSSQKQKSKQKIGVLGPESSKATPTILFKNTLKSLLFNRRFMNNLEFAMRQALGVAVASTIALSSKTPILALIPINTVASISPNLGSTFDTTVDVLL